MDDDDDLSHLRPKTLTLLCTIGGVLVPRGGTGKFRCVNGETRLVSLDRSRPITFSTLRSKIVSLYCHSKKHNPPPSSLRYVHPSAPPNLMDDRPSLVSVASDADVRRMVEEHDRARARRVRIFVVDDDGKDKGLVEERVFGRSWDVNVAVSPPQNGVLRGGGDFVGVGKCSPGVRARSSGRGVVQDRILQPGVERSLAHQEGNQLLFVDRVVNDVVPLQTSYVPSPDHYQPLLDSQNSNGRPCLSQTVSSAKADSAHPSLHSLSGATGCEVERVGPGSWSVCMNIVSEIDWTNQTDFKCGDSVVSGKDGLTVDVYGIGPVIDVSSAINTLCSSLNGNDVALPGFITRSGTSTLPNGMQLCLNHEDHIMNFCRSSSFITMRSAKSMSCDPANFTVDNSIEDATGMQFLQKGLPPPSSLLTKLSIDAGRAVTDCDKNQKDAHSSSKREEKPKIEKPKPTCSIMLPEIGSNLSSSCPQLAVRELQTINNSDLEEIRELGSGTYGTVFYGKWRGSDVAIKRSKPSCFPGSNLEGDRMVSDLWKEAYLMAQLHHPNVVAFYGIATDGKATNLATVTEYMVNGSLKQVMQRKDRTIDRRKRLIIAMDAAFGMEYLHAKNIVHFDLKSHNFLVNMKDPHRPVCKIGDLGLSKVKGQTLVSAGVRGTIPWMAPELLTNSMVTEKVDVYSFGIVMWELLTGEEPYENMHSEEMIAGIVKGSLRPTIPLWCDPEWKSLMERCWSSDATLRPSFSEIASELRVIAAAMNIR